MTSKSGEHRRLHCLLCGALGFPSEHDCQFRGLDTVQSFGQHEFLCVEAQPCTHLYVISEGQVKLTTSGVDGRERIIGLSVPGHLIGFEALDEHIYTYTVETLTPVTVCRIRCQEMRRLMEEYPDVTRRVLELLNRQLVQAQALIRILGNKPSSAKVASFILAYAPCSNIYSDEMELFLSREEMAGMLGLREETVSRAVADLKRQGIILARRERILVLDKERLQRLAGDVVVDCFGQRCQAYVQPPQHDT